MMDEGKLHQQHERGAAAEAELRRTGEAFAELRAFYVKAWEGSDARDTAGREKLWVAMTILSKVEGMLRRYVADGKIAAADLDAIRKAGEPKRRLFSLV